MRLLAIISAAAVALIAGVWSSKLVGITFSTTTQVIITAVVVPLWLGIGGYLLLMQKRAVAAASRMQDAT